MNKSIKHILRILISAAICFWLAFTFELDTVVRIAAFTLVYIVVSLILEKIIKSPAEPLKNKTKKLIPKENRFLKK